MYISLKNVYKDFYGLASVTDINLDIPDNELVVLTGPAVSGKSVILRMIAGIEKVTSGGIYFNNELYNRVPLKKRNAAFIFKKNSYFKNKTLYENIALGLKLRKVNDREIDKKVASAAEILGLQDKLKEKQKFLSDDVKQLACIARAVIRNPDVLLVDEPFSELFNGKLIEKFLNLTKAFPLTCIYATENFGDVEYLNKKTAVLRSGIIQQFDIFGNICNNPVNSFVENFIKRPKIWFLKGLSANQIRFKRELWIKENKR